MAVQCIIIKLIPSISNCTFSENTATGNGGAIYNYDSAPGIINCIVWGNSAASGESIYNFGTGLPYISYSDIEGCGASGGSWDSTMGIDGDNNIDETPLFEDPDGTDDIPGTLDDDTDLQSTSPCNDSGIAGESMGESILADATSLLTPASVTNPVDLELDSNGQLFVLSSSQNQVLIYDGQLSLQDTITVSTTNPKGIGLDSDDNLYIADTGADQYLEICP